METKVRALSREPVYMAASLRERHKEKLHYIFLMRVISFQHRDSDYHLQRVAP